MHKDFLTKCGDNLYLPAPGQQEAHNIIVLNLDEEYASQTQSLFHVLSEQYGLRGLKQLNYHGIAKVCRTDVNTVELIIKEIVATIVRQTIDDIYRLI